VANRTYSEDDGRFDVSGGQHDTEDRKMFNGLVESVAKPTTVGEQVANGGWARSERPVGDDPAVLPGHKLLEKYQGGSAGSGGRRVDASYPGTPSGP
jgi:hypothetical protein